MTKRSLATATLVAAVSLSTIAAGASANGPAEPADPAATWKSATGVITEGTNAAGQPAYYLTPADGDPIELSYGPSWAYGDASPLHSFVGSEVTVIGQVRDGVPNDNASETAHAQADGVLQMRVRAIVGEELRGPGRPPWAGGPKVVGEVHPGYEGWSEGQAEKAAEMAERDEEKAAAKAARATDKAERAAEKAAAKAERAEAKAAAKAARAAAKAARAAGRAHRP